VDKALLFQPRLPEEDVEIPGVGTIRVRGMTRLESLLITKLNDQSVVRVEKFMLAAAMVDPVLTEHEVEQWQKASPAGEIRPVIDVINRLSGITRGADKSGVPGDGPESEPGVRVLPGAEAGDDGGPAAAGDAG